jgi:hypothetical protein
LRKLKKVCKKTKLKRIKTEFKAKIINSAKAEGEKG